MAICAELKRATPTVPVGTIDELYRIFKDPAVTSTIDSVRAALEQERLALEVGLESKAKEYKKEANRLKSSLPGIIFQASSFKEHEWIDSKKVNHGMGAWRHQEHVMMNGLFIVDIDHVENPRDLWKQLVDKKAMDWNPFFVFVSRLIFSVRHFVWMLSVVPHAIQMVPDGMPLHPSPAYPVLAMA